MPIIRTTNIPYLIQPISDDMACLIAPNGEIQSSSEMMPLIQALEKFYTDYDDEYIDYLNYQNAKKAKSQYEQESVELERKKAERVKESHKGYVYIFKCADKYKIGFSNDVERRLKQLDTRPFKLEYIYSKYFDNAWYIEQWLHNESDITVDKVEGEWYKISDEHLESLINWLERLTDGQWEEWENNDN